MDSSYVACDGSDCEPTIAQVIGTNESHHFGFFCVTCSRRGKGLTGANPVHLPHDWVEKITGLSIEEAKVRIPVVKHREGAMCEVRGCDRTDTEIHHWAPSAIFDEESVQWPTGSLCVSHHAEWHRRVTPRYVRQEAKLDG